MFIPKVQELFYLYRRRQRIIGILYKTQQKIGLIILVNGMYLLGT